jgi:hypothetical protein
LEITSAVEVLRLCIVRMTLKISDLMVDIGDKKVCEATICAPNKEIRRLSSFGKGKRKQTRIRKHVNINDDLWERFVDIQDISNRGMKTAEMHPLGKMLQSVWADKSFLECISKLDDMHLETEMMLRNVLVFSDRIEEVFTSDFKLSNEEYIHIRCKTTAIQKTRGDVVHPVTNKLITFELLDVGGQHWFHDDWKKMIEDNSAKQPGILYMASLDDYRHRHQPSNAELASMKTKSQSRIKVEPISYRLTAALHNFAILLEEPLLRGEVNPTVIPIVVLLNKVDLFKTSLVQCTNVFCKAFPNARCPEKDENHDTYANYCVDEVKREFKKVFTNSTYYKTTKGMFVVYVTDAAHDCEILKAIFFKLVLSLLQIHVSAAGYC